MNLSTMRDALRSKIGTPNIQDVPDSTLTRICNAAYREVASKYPFTEVRCIKSFNTAVGTDRYDIPVDLAVLYRLWDDTNKKKLRKRGVRYLATQPKNVQPGKPVSYVRVRDYIQLVPTPDDIYALMIYYLTEIGDMVLDTDEPVLPLPWHDGLVLKARHIYYDERGDIGKAIYSKNEWKDWVADKPSEIDLEKDDLDDTGVVIPTLGGEHSHSRGLYGDYRHFPTRFDFEDR